MEANEYVYSKLYVLMNIFCNTCFKINDAHNWPKLCRFRKSQPTSFILSQKTTECYVSETHYLKKLQSKSSIIYNHQHNYLHHWPHQLAHWNSPFLCSLHRSKHRLEATQEKLLLLQGFLEVALQLHLMIFSKPGGDIS